MVKEKLILLKFSLYLLTCLLIVFIGVSNVFGLTYIDIGEMRNVTTVLVAPEYSSQPFDVPSNSGYAFNQVLEVDYIVDNYNFEANKNYQLESYLAQQRFTNVNRYTVQTYSGKSCLISYENSILNNDAYPRWAFQCPENTTSITISLTNSNGQYLWSGTGIFDWRTALLKYSDTSLSGSGSDSDNIINNQNQNTQSIINNQNENTQAIIDSQQVCNELSITSASIIGYLDSNGDIVSDNNWKVTDFIRTDSLTISNKFSTAPSVCFYNNKKELISCYNYGSLSNGSITLPSNTKYFKASIYMNSNLQQYYGTPKFETKYCDNGNEAVTNSINGLNDSLNDDDTNGATDEASDFFSEFNTNTFGLTSIITAPLNLIQSLTSKTCTSLHLPLPYLNNKYLDLPCMSSIYQQHFGSFFTIYQTITYGIIAYWVVVRIFNHVKDFKNPEHDEIEVVDL